MSITWNGVSSDTIGVIVERIPNRYVPTRRFSPQQVAGRNGNILLVDKAFPNVEQEYEVYLSAEAQGLPSVARACAEWLMGPDGYCRLEDSYDTTVYREAFLMGGFDIENILNKFGRCTITFSCKPQKYLLTGDTPIEIPDGTTTTYTGDVVQFDVITGASITSLSTTITPTQDLHGYSHPWPAGGGKNKLNFDGIKTIGVRNGSATWGDNTVTMTATSNDCYLQYGAASWSEDVRIPVSEGDVVRFTWTANNALGNAGIFPNGTASDFALVQSDAGIASLTVKPGYSFVTIRVGVTLSGDSTTYSNLMVTVNNADTTFAPYSNICPISGLTGLSVYVSPTQDPADATVYNVDWSTQAGTVYGGTLDVVTGMLTVTHGYVDLTTGMSGGSAGSGYVFYKALTNPKTVPNSQIAPIISEAYSAIRYNGVAANVNTIAIRDNGMVYVNTGSSTTLPVGSAVYTLATPLTYQLTPKEVEALVGTNNVWSSSGDVSVTVITPLGGIVTNPTPFEARPLLTVSGVGEIAINGKSIQILESVSDFEIDCEMMEAEDNSKIYCMDFPELSGGGNKIVGYGSVTALTVTPRWWTL